MNMVTSAIPVIFINPINSQIEEMPIEMIGAYFPNGTMLCLEEAAKVACVRDHDAAANLLESCFTIRYSVSNLEGTGFDVLGVEPPSLR